MNRRAHVFTATNRAATVRSNKGMRFAGESACATTGKSFACNGGAGAFACQFFLGAILSHFVGERTRRAHLQQPASGADLLDRPAALVDSFVGVGHATPVSPTRHKGDR
jgi:hypothetical protein